MYILNKYVAIILLEVSQAIVTNASPPTQPQNQINVMVNIVVIVNIIIITFISRGI